MSKIQAVLSRRRFIRIAASAVGLVTSDFAVAQRAAEIWRGTALGALASIELQGVDPSTARRLIASCVGELERLERMFSLYRADSFLSLLNRAGSLDLPPLDLVSLLSICQGYNSLTEGAFDPTVQPLWELYAQHFSRPNPNPEGPAEERMREAAARVGFARIKIGSDRIALDPGTALTLNGVAQGYVTDRVTELLRAEGVRHTLVDLGEIRAMGRRADGRRWAVGLEDADHPGAIAQTLEVDNCAVATSGGYGFRFDAAGRFNHLFEPKTGKSPSLYKSVTVIAPTATAADALSTAFCLMDVEKIQRVLGKMQGCEALLTFANGRTDRLRSTFQRERNAP